MNKQKDTLEKSGDKLPCGRETCIRCKKCPYGEGGKAKKLEECRIVIVIDVEEIKVCIADVLALETKTVKNPLSIYENFAAASNAYEHDKNKISTALRSAISLECVELIEKYGVAQAEYCAIASPEFYLKVLTKSDLNAKDLDYDVLCNADKLSLPCESVTVLPFVNTYVGAEILCETVCIKEPALIIDCEKTAAFIALTKEGGVISAMWDIDYRDRPLATRIFRAAARFMSEDLEVKKPIVYLTGRHKSVAESVLLSLDMPYIVREKDINNVVDACVNMRTNAKVIKERARMSIINNMFMNEKFQNYFVGG